MKPTIPLILLMVAVLALAPGCTHNLTTLDAAGNVEQATSTANTSRLGPDGTQQATNLGIGPTLLKQDSEGNWTNMPGPAGVLSYIPATGQMFLVSPADAMMTGVKFTPTPNPGEPAFEADTISFNISEPLKQQVAAYIQAVQSLEGMTKTEAEARVAQLQAAGEITATIAEALLKYFVPTLPIGGE